MSIRHAFFIYIHTDTEINDKIFVYYILTCYICGDNCVASRMGWWAGVLIY